MSYTIINEYPGHSVTKGKCAGQTRNPYRHIKNSETNDEYYEMDTHGKNKTKFTFDIKDLHKVNNMYNAKIKDIYCPTWYEGGNGYISAHLPGHITGYLHYRILNHEPTKGVYIDHIDKDTTNNRNSNLRIVSQAIQNNNQDIRKNKFNLYRIFEPYSIEIGIPQLSVKAICKYNMRTKQITHFKKVRTEPIQTAFKIYGSSLLNKPFPNYICYGKSSGNYGNYFYVQIKILKHDLVIKTTKSSLVPTTYKFRQALLIRYYLINTHWNLQDIPLLNIDGILFKKIDDIRLYTKKLINEYTNENIKTIKLNYEPPQGKKNIVKTYIEECNKICKYYKNNITNQP
jgi:hypothetical protein